MQMRDESSQDFIERRKFGSRPTDMRICL